MATNLDGAFRRIVEAADELDQGRLRGAGSAEDADDLSALDMEVDVLERGALCLLGVLEAHVVEIDGAVWHLHDRVLGVGKRRLLLQDLADTPRGLFSHRDHDEDHGEHHEAYEEREAVGDERGELAHAHGLRLGRDDGHRAEVDDEGVDDIDCQRHERRVPGKDALHVHEVMIEGAGSLIELLLLVILAHIGLDDADAGDVLLDGIVQAVVLAEDAAEDRHGCERDLEDGIAKEEGDDHVDDCHGAAGDKRHDDGEEGKHRAADGCADDHHVGLLDVRDIGREPRHERACREAVDIGEREALDLVEQVMPQVLGKAGRTDGAGDACGGAERK